MEQHDYQMIERAISEGGAQAAFEHLAERFRAEKNYPLLFETRLMKARYDLGLPLVHLDNEIPDDNLAAYEAATIGAARETGRLFLDDGQIERAWPYLRAVGDIDVVRAAIERVDSGRENLDRLIEIAYHERAHPLKGYELILETYGTCRAITFFHQYPDAKTREEGLRLLARRLHSELTANLRRAIESVEGTAPEGGSIPELIEGRGWLFGEYDAYADTSHVVSVLNFLASADARDLLELGVEMAAYGQRLAPMFQQRSDPPFDDFFRDIHTYLNALLGNEVDSAAEHFTHKAREYDPDQYGYGAAEALVVLLARTGRYAEAIEASLEFLSGANPQHVGAPTVLQLCQMAGDAERLRALARERGDLLHYAAAALMDQRVC